MSRHKEFEIIRQQQKEKDVLQKRKEKFDKQVEEYKKNQLELTELLENITLYDVQKQLEISMKGNIMDENLKIAAYKYCKGKN